MYEVEVNGSDLIPDGMCVLFFEGKIVWSGSIDDRHGLANFDRVLISATDFVRYYLPDEADDNGGATQ